MDFSVTVLHDLEDRIEGLSDNLEKTLKCGKLGNITRNMLTSKSLTKDNLADITLNMLSVISESRKILRLAAAKFDDQKSELVENQKRLLQIQDELIECKNSEIDVVKDTVKTEIKSFSEIVKQKSDQPFAPSKLKEAIKSVAVEEERSKNVLFFGIPESKATQGTNQNQADRSKLGGLLYQWGMKAEIVDSCRLGVEERGKTRPIKAKFSCADTTRRLLSSAKDLRNTTDYKKCYIAPDRTKEERDARKKLVDEMKRLIETEPTKYHYIRNNKVCSVNRLFKS